ncbi:GntR family transcriptional regulator [Paraburkholderia sp. UYCP14C]|uniref:GntR family transcriptional regulator n=1 Tax=Paraburkholderia sp. UYCP14C TaxID=2511130 RepID=UPI001459FC82|nr:GntR family transcriptional regulator [Paraburkholderia sp. UYCP14C]
MQATKRVDGASIFETLRRRISTNEYPAGTKLKEIDLAEEFGVSRTPIRQVLQRLELAGLVQPIVGHGTIVTGMDLSSIKEVLQFRAELSTLLEPFVDLKDVNDTLKELDKLKIRQGKLAKKFDAVEYAVISHEIRACIARHISNRYMADVWLNSYYVASRVWFSSFASGIDAFMSLQEKELSDLYGAFSAKDASALARVEHETIVAWSTAVWSALRLA